jgi:transcription elongation factor GreA
MEAVRKKLQTELDDLEEELHFKLPKEIQKAREFGDLRENAEYKAAMERQSMVQARIMQVRLRLSEVESIDVSKLPTDSVAYGSKVVLYDVEKDEDITYKLVTSEESDPANGLISTFRQSVRG